MTKAQVDAPGGPATALTVVGCVLVAAFFAPWIDLGGVVSWSGWELAREDATRLFLVPALGIALILAGATRSKLLPLVAALAGLTIVGTTAYYTVRTTLKFDYGALITLIGGGIALAGIADKQRGLRALGGALALAGFFLPWAPGHSGFDIARDTAGLDVIGISILSLWAIPAGAVLGLFAATDATPRGRTLAGLSGAVVLLGFFWFLGALVNLIAGWGAWTALGGGVAAGVLALFSGGRSSARA